MSMHLSITATDNNESTTGPAEPTTIKEHTSIINPTTTKPSINVTALAICMGIIALIVVMVILIAVIVTVIVRRVRHKKEYKPNHSARGTSSPLPVVNHA